MTLGDIATKARALINQDTTSYPNANLLIDINLWYQKTATMILESQDEIDWDDSLRSDYPTGTIPLTTNRDYSISTTEKILKIKDVNISYDGVTYYKGTPIDSGEFYFGQGPQTATSNEAIIDGNFSRTSPGYDYKYGSIFLYPKATAADVSAGGLIFLEWQRQVQEFTLSDLTTGTAIPGFDDPFHPILAYGPAFELASSRGLQNTESLFTMLTDYERRLKQAYGNKQHDRQFVLKPNIGYYGTKSGGYNNSRGFTN